MTRQTSIQLTEATEAQIAALREAGYGNTTNIIRTAIDRMAHQEGHAGTPAAGGMRRRSGCAACSRPETVDAKQHSLCNRATRGEYHEKADRTASWIQLLAEKQNNG